MRKSKGNMLAELLLMEDNPMTILGIRTENQLLYFIDDIERIVRHSREYRLWLFLKKYKHRQTICKILGIDTANYDGIQLETHHHPVTLYDVVYIIGMKMLSLLKKDEYLTTFQIASQVIEDHLSEDNLIGTVSLTVTYHQMYHSGIQTLDIKDINGNYQLFLDKYKQFIPEAIQERINNNLNSNK